MVVVIDCSFDFVNFVVGCDVYYVSYVFGVFYMYFDNELLGFKIGINGCYLLFDVEVLVVCL